MEDIDYWRLNQSLTIVQAALLVVGADPGQLGTYVENWSMEDRPSGYEAAKFAIRTALLKGDIEGKVVEEFISDINDNHIGGVPGTANIFMSEVEVESLRAWLERRGFRSGFFFPKTAGQPDYLDPDHPHYAPKLAAAVKAWLANRNDADLKGKHPKQALLKSLRESAAEFGLTDDEGKPMETTIDDIAKIANWQQKGGAPKTPGQVPGDDGETETTSGNDESDPPF